MMRQKVDEKINDAYFKAAGKTNKQEFLEAEQVMTLEELQNAALCDRYAKLESLAQEGCSSRI